MVEQVSSIIVLAVCQAVDLRAGEPRASRSAQLHAALRKTIPMLDEDRRQDLDIQEVLERLRRDELPIGTLE